MVINSFLFFIFFFLQRCLKAIISSPSSSKFITFFYDWIAIMAFMWIYAEAYRVCYYFVQSTLTITRMKDETELNTEYEQWLERIHLYGKAHYIIINTSMEWNGSYSQQNVKRFRIFQLKLMIYYRIFVIEIWNLLFLVILTWMPNCFQTEYTHTHTHRKKNVAVACKILKNIRYELNISKKFPERDGYFAKERKIWKFANEWKRRNSIRDEEAWFYWINKEHTIFQ